MEQQEAKPVTFRFFLKVNPLVFRRLRETRKEVHLAQDGLDRTSRPFHYELTIPFSQWLKGRRCWSGYEVIEKICGLVESADRKI
jgi:hypothetical protein